MRTIAENANAFLWGLAAVLWAVGLPAFIVGVGS